MAEPNLFSLAEGISDFVERKGQKIVHVGEQKPAPPTDGSSQCFFFHRNLARKPLFLNRGGSAILLSEFG